VEDLLPPLSLLLDFFVVHFTCTTKKCQEDQFCDVFSQQELAWNLLSTSGQFFPLTLFTQKNRVIKFNKHLLKNGCFSYLLDTKGNAFNTSHQSSSTSIASFAIASFSTAFRCLLAWRISCYKYAVWKVFTILKKYSRSGTLPLAIFLGKYFMIVSSDYIIGQSLITDNSS
jgi:hypothetical protein